MRIRIALLGLGLALGACSAPAPASPTPELLPLPSATPTAAAGAPTPVIIASSTPTPTPVTYVVQKGDTLVGIAVKYGISVAALQAANNNVQPQYLPIGAVLTIPGPEGGPVLSAGMPPAPTSVPVALSAPACYPVVTGALYCFVEARNPGGAPVGNVSARITLAGADGMPLARGAAYAALDVIPPGAAAPMALLFPSAPAGIAATGVELLTASSVSTSTAGYIPLEIPAHTSAAAGGLWTAAGQVRNPSAAPAASAWLTLTIYDASGAIVGYRKQPLPGGLAPGAAQDFSISADALGGAADHLSLAAEGRP